VQDVVVNKKSLAKSLVKDIGLANLPSLTKLCLTDGYKKQLIKDVIEYLSSENALKIKLFNLSCFKRYYCEYIQILFQVERMTLQELFLSNLNNCGSVL